jgi:hypothetical protein
VAEPAAYAIRIESGPHKGRTLFANQFGWPLPERLLIATVPSSPTGVGMADVTNASEEEINRVVANPVVKITEDGATLVEDVALYVRVSMSELGDEADEIPVMRGATYKVEEQLG